MIERYFEELEVSQDQEKAAFTCLSDLFLPGVTGVISDSGGILVLSVATIPLIEKLAYYGSFWAFANIFCITHTMPYCCHIFRPQSKRNILFRVGWRSR